MKKILIVTSAVAASLALLSAYAAPAQSGVFVSADLGVGYISTPSSNGPSTNIASQSVKNYDLAWGLAAGYNHAVNQNFLLGAELGYNDEGQGTYDQTFTDGTSANGTINPTDWNLLVDATYLANNGFNVFGKLGVAYISQDTDVDASDSGRTISAEKDVTLVAPKLVVGAGYYFNTHLNAFLSYAHTFANATSTYPIDVSKVYSSNVFAAGLSYTFPTKW